MPLTACPECRHVVAVRSEQLGHRTRCPNCGETFRPERMPVSFQQFFRAGHAGGAWVGAILLIVGLVLGVLVALASEGWKAEILAKISTQLALNGAIICIFLGGLLLVRHFYAQAQRPQPIGPRKPGGVVTPLGAAGPPKSKPPAAGV
jgi:hypothetical protein